MTFKKEYKKNIYSKNILINGKWAKKKMTSEQEMTFISRPHGLLTQSLFIIYTNKHCLIHGKMRKKKMTSQRNGFS